VDDNTYKNALGVGVPGSRETGLVFAAAMGTLSSKKVERGLQILENPKRETIEKAQAHIVQIGLRLLECQMLEIY
jgi:L-cysteine desulfidase